MATAKGAKATQDDSSSNAKNTAPASLWQPRPVPGALLGPTDDRQWFARRPRRSHRCRPATAQERALNGDLGMAIVRQQAPGLRVRYYFPDQHLAWLRGAPDEVLGCLVDLAHQRPVGSFLAMQDVFDEAMRRCSLRGLA